MKRLLIAGIVFIAVIAGFVIRNMILKDKSVTIESVNLDTIDERYIGSEPPKLLYADHEKVIFECSGVFVYDIKEQELIKSFDPYKSLPSKQSRWGSLVTADGRQILFYMINEDGSSKAAYCYDFGNDQCEKINIQEYKKAQKRAFKCTELEYEDPLYQKSSGRIAKLSETEYIYLAFENWLLNTIQIVHVQDGNETSYHVFHQK